MRDKYRKSLLLQNEINVRKETKRYRVGGEIGGRDIVVRKTGGAVDYYYLLFRLIIEFLMTYSGQHFRENLACEYGIFEVCDFSGFFFLAFSKISFRLPSAL
jgi:hypothetical protein